MNIRFLDVSAHSVLHGPQTELRGGSLLHNWRVVRDVFNFSVASLRGSMLGQTDRRISVVQTYHTEMASLVRCHTHAS